MRDMLHRMLRGGRVFLDSSELTDLRHLFELGVERSETLVVLATRGVFTRPVCLLEIWTAARAHIPVIVVEIAGRGFKISEAAELLNKLETHLQVISRAQIDPRLPHALRLPSPDLPAFHALCLLSPTLAGARRTRRRASRETQLPAFHGLRRASC